MEVGSVGKHHAPFLERKAHTRPCPVLRGRKSGFAPVGMTRLERGGFIRFGWLVERTADPSAALGMTKETVALPFAVMVLNDNLPNAVHSTLNLSQASLMLGMTKGRVPLPFTHDAG